MIQLTENKAPGAVPIAQFPGFTKSQLDSPPRIGPDFFVCSSANPGQNNRAGQAHYILRSREPLMLMNMEVLPDIEAISHAAMDRAMAIVQEAVAKRGRFAIALSGGHTPEKMYELWAANPYRDKTPWDRVHLFWGDERYVAHDDPQSNFRMARETLISKVPIPPANVHPIPTLPGPPEKSAQTYEEELHDFFGATAEFDLQLQGIGPDGHTASLFPGSPVLEDNQRWVLPVKMSATPPFVPRITVTLAVLNAGRNTFFLVAGKDKREIIGALRAEPDGKKSKYPAGRVQPPGPVIWFLDRAAAGES